MAIQRKRVQLTKKKRKWVSIHAPKEFGSVQFGESYVNDANNLIGKKVKVDLSIISKTRNPNVRLVFKIKEIADGKGICEPVSYYILPAFIKRFVRKGKTKADNVFKLKSKDGVSCVIKIIFVTKSKVKSSISKALRVELDKMVRAEFSKKTFSQLLDSVMSYHFQKSFKIGLSKLYPLQALEVRLF